jgi:hypothetical protein
LIIEKKAKNEVGEKLKESWFGGSAPWGALWRSGNVLGLCGNWVGLGEIRVNAMKPSPQEWNWHFTRQVGIDH